MKPTELRIGDYVKYQGHIYIIEEISAKGWVHLIYPETKTRVNMASDYIIDLLEPISLSPMNYEQKYKEALERARKIENREPINVPDGTSIPVAIFPELKESKCHNSEKV